MSIGELIALGAEVAGLPIAYWIGKKIARRNIRNEELTDPRCTGYQGAVAMQHDCNSLRDLNCDDGRCSWHCSRMCKCNASNSPETIGRRKK